MTALISGKQKVRSVCMSVIWKVKFIYGGWRGNRQKLAQIHFVYYFSITTVVSLQYLAFAKSTDWITKFTFSCQIIMWNKLNRKLRCSSQTNCVCQFLEITASIWDNEDWQRSHSSRSEYGWRFAVRQRCAYFLVLIASTRLPTIKLIKQIQFYYNIRTLVHAMWM